MAVTPLIITVFKSYAFLLSHSLSRVYGGGYTAASVVSLLAPKDFDF